MNPNSDIQKFIENLSSEIEPMGEKEIRLIIPQKPYKDKDILYLLHNSYKFFQHTFCHRPKITRSLVQKYCDGDYIILDFFVRDSDKAYELTLLRMEHPPSEFFSQTSYTLCIVEFNYKKTIKNLGNYIWLTSECRPFPVTNPEPFYKECKTILDFKFKKTHYTGPIGVIIRWFRNRYKKYRIKNELYREFKELEKNMSWFADQGIKTFKTEQ